MPCAAIIGDPGARRDALATSKAAAARAALQPSDEHALDDLSALRRSDRAPPSAEVVVIPAAPPPSFSIRARAPSPAKRAERSERSISARKFHDFGDIDDDAAAHLRPRGCSAPAAAMPTAAPSRSSARAGRAAGRGPAAARPRSARRSGHITESMPSRLTPRSRNGITVAGRSLPPASPQAATLARYLSCVRIVAKVVPPTASIAPAQRSLSSGRAGSAASARAVDQLGGAEPFR